MRRYAIIAFLVGAAGVAALLLTGDSSSLPLPAESVLDDPVLQAIDEAMFTKVPLLDTQVDFPRPALEVERRLNQYAAGAAPDPRFLAAFADVQVSLSKFDEAERTMQRLAETHTDKQEGLRKLAAFYHARLMIAEEVETLRRLALMQEPDDRVATNRGILSLLDEYLLNAVDREAILRANIEAQPDEPEHVESLIEYLIKRGRRSEALAGVESGLKRFKDRRRAFLALNAKIFQDDGKEAEALSVYDFSFDPVDDIEVYGDYLALLRRLDRYTDYERSLRRRFRLEQLDDRGRCEHFLLLRSQRSFDQAAKALDKWVEVSGRLGAEKLSKFAGAYEAIGATEQAWRLRYTQFILAGDATEKEEALCRLFDLTWNLRGPEKNLTGRSAGSYLGLDYFDTSPGVAGGLLSLLYNTQNVNDKLDDLGRISRDYENRKLLMRIFEQYKTEYPDSQALAKMYSRVVILFDEYNWPRNALRYADEFMKAFPDDENYYDVAEASVSAHRRLGAESKVRELYRGLIRRADSRDERDDYFKYLSNLVSSFVSKRDYAGAITTYWNEINANPQEEQLYQRLLEFLGRYRIYNEELKVYQRAIEEFGKRTYYDKLARWYIRQRRNSDLQDLTRRIADIFEESELAEFFGDFVETGRDAGNPDSVFYRTMFEYANRRFPRNMRFVRGLLDFYSRFQLWPEFDDFSKRYFYASASIRKGWLRSLSRRNLLKSTLESFTGGAPVESLEGSPESPAEKLLLAELTRWNSVYESAEPLYGELIEDYPGDEELVANLAALRRSFGRGEDAVSLYSRLASIFPREKKYPTAAGEILVENGRTDEAARFWRRIIAIKPSDSDLYLEVASIFWDYYQFDRAAEVLLGAREQLDDPQLFGNKLAAVYESAKDYKRAITEYVRTTALATKDGYGFDEPLRRLVYLADRKAMSQDIDLTFTRASDDNSDEPGYIESYADFLARLKRGDERLELLRGAISRYNERGFISWLVQQFRSAGSPADEEKALRRLLVLEGENRENLLTLAGFYERQGRFDDAEAMLLRRVEMTRTDEPEELPDYLAALDDAAGFAWRHDRFDKAFEWWGAAARAASASAKPARLHSLSQRYIQRERFAEAAAILEELLQGAPSVTEYYNTLAQIYTKQEDYAGLADLNRRAIEGVRADKSLSSDDKTYRIADLRLDLIGNLIELGDFTAAVDQYIEIINRQYDAENYIVEAFRFTRGHNLLDRLVAYYTDLSGKSFKDFRWNVVLARLNEQRNDLEAAADQWSKAVRNEPQRIELRTAQADVYLKLQRYADAVDVYRQVYRLDRRNTSWLYTIARTQAIAGDMKAARATLESTLETGPEGFSKYFEAARILEGWGEVQAAADKLELGLTELRKDIYKQSLSSGDLDMLVRVGIKLGNVVETFDTLLALNNIYNNEASREGNQRAWLARQGLDLTFKAFSGAFARALNAYATNEQRRLIADRMSGYLNNFPENQGTVNFVRGSTEPMGFAEITERAVGLKLGFLNNYDKRYDYRDEILASLRYFGGRGQWKEAADMLERERSRSNLFYFRGEMLTLLAKLYRYGGDLDSEAGILRNFVIDTGGKKIEFSSSHDLVERYLTILLERASEAELREAAGMANAYTGQIINFFLSRSRPDLAAAAIDAAALKRNPKWRDSKKMLIETYFDTEGIDLGVRTSPDVLMGIKPIGELIAAQPDRQRVLAGSEWFGFARHFAEGLHSTGDERYGSFAIAPAEQSPRSTEAQRQIARFYTGHEQYDEALRHYGLALQIAPNDPATFAELGELHLKRGNSEEAMRTWEKIISGDAGIAAYSRYFDVLEGNGMVAEAARTALNYLKQETAKSFTWSHRELMEIIFFGLKNEGESLAYFARTIVEMADRVSEPIALLRFAIDDLDFPAEEKLNIYRKVIALASEIKSSDVSSEAGYFDEEYGWSSATELDRYWLEQAFRFAVDNEIYEAALEWIGAYEARGYTEEIWGYLRGEGRYWQYKAKALLGAGRKSEALEALKGVYDTKPPRLNLYEIAHRILLDFGEREEAERLMIGYYRDALAAGRDGSGVYTGLAAILLDRAGRESNPTQTDSLTAEAFSLLESMVNKRANNKEGMNEAASLLERRDLRSEALRYRRMLHKLDRWDHANTLELAKDDAAVGNAEEAATLLRELLIGGQVPRAVKRGVGEPYLALFEGRQSQAAAELQAIEKIKDTVEECRLVYAEMALAAGNRQLFLESINSGLEFFLEPSLLEKRKAEIELEAGNVPNAIDYFHRSLAHEPTASTRLALLRTLLDAGQWTKALQLLDAFDDAGSYSLGQADLSGSLGLEGEKLLDLISGLVDASLTEKLFDIAESFENRRIELAADLKVVIESRRDEIEEARKRAAPPEPPVRILDSIAN